MDKPKLGGKKSQKGGTAEGGGSEFGGPSDDGANGGTACATVAKGCVQVTFLTACCVVRLGSLSAGTRWVNKKPPPSVAGDMFAEMAWKKKQKAAKQEWMEANGKA